MNKVVIIGNAGGGKSTLGKLLSQAKGLPFYQLDRFIWKPGWIKYTEKEFTSMHNTVLNKKHWIIDGFYTIESDKERLNAADTIIFIDYHLWMHYWWASKRQFMCLFGARPDFIANCPMLPKTWTLVKIIWKYNKYYRPILLDIIDQSRLDKTVFHIHSPKELSQFISNYCSNYTKDNTD
jgi:adenylate kinase family enzyme